MKLNEYFGRDRSHLLSMDGQLLNATLSHWQTPKDLVCHPVHGIDIKAAYYIVIYLDFALKYVKITGTVSVICFCWWQPCLTLVLLLMFRQFYSSLLRMNELTDLYRVVKSVWDNLLWYRHWTILNFHSCECSTSISDLALPHRAPQPC